MLGPYYEKAWDFERRASSQDPPFPFSQRPERQKKRVKFSSQMHLSNNDNFALGGGGSSHVAHAESKNLNGATHETYTGRALNGNGVHTDDNEVFVTFPTELARETLLNDIVTGWILLLQRYQRDAFQGFTLGLEEAGEGSNQYVNGGQLDLSSVTTVADLVERTRGIKLDNITGNENTASSLSLNDGTKDEVNPPRPFENGS